MTTTGGKYSNVKEDSIAVLAAHERIEDRCMKILWNERDWEECLGWQTQDKKFYVKEEKKI